MDANAKIVGSASQKLVRRDYVTILKTTLTGILLYSSESPQLYTVHAYLKETAETVHQISEKVGGRTIEIRRGDGIYVNGYR